LQLESGLATFRAQTYLFQIGIQIYILKENVTFGLSKYNGQEHLFW